ncbi:MAG: MetQ/NlpA family ABC transporter substrate-binding protein [Alphaproteobacteria bacterium]|jgi:D-methionine transport system substrate-binding protein|nr:MetQ/NlpA family ABC transporter substrate-binding protein [Alphaproteobacteria bacterium]
MKQTFSVLFATLFFSLSAPALKVGVTAGPHADIIHKLSELAKKQSLNVEIIEFNDFILPNEALSAGDIDLNSFQHEQYLNGQIDTRGYKFKAIGKTVIMPLGLYSSKLKSLNELSKGAKIIIPNDPTNGGRALKLLAKNGVIEVKDVANPCILDITSNPKNISFVEIEAALVPRSLPDVDAAITNTDWILQAGLNPKSAIVQEDKNSPYVNVLVVRTQDEGKEDIQKFVKLYHTPEIRTFIEEKYKGAVIPGW